MKKEIAYIAFDGKRFNSEKECQAYEEQIVQQYLKAEKIACFDADGDRLYSGRVQEDILFFFIEDESAIPVAQLMFEKTSVPEILFIEPGWWVYFTGIGEWMHADQLNEIMTILKEVKKTL
jgi:hypothetical protein